MRNYLLAGAAFIAVGSLLSVGARAQSPVFPVDSTAGKLDGAAPGSVTVTLGGRIFSAIEFQGGTGNNGPDQRSNPQLFSYIRLYPSFDYANPSGVHFGVAIEIRTGAGFAGSQQGVGSESNTLGVFSGQGYVSSDRFGKFAFGTPNDAIDQLGVGVGDDFGTGGFFGEYGWVNSPIWMMADAYDGDIPKQKLAYYSPSFAGFTLGVSYQPTSVGLSNAGDLTDNGATGSAFATATGAQSRNRIEGAAQYAHAFGPVAVKADVGYAHAEVSKSAEALADGLNYQDVSMVNVGGQLNFAGFELEASVNTGKFAYNYIDSGSPMGPSLQGAHNTTAYIAGVGYTFGPYSIGAQYYGVQFDQGDFGLSNSAGTLQTGHSGRLDGVAVGGSYTVGPGVSVNFDFADNETKTPGGLQTLQNGGTATTTHGTLLGIGTYINW